MWTHVRKVYLPKVDWQFVLDLPCFLFPVRCDWIQTFISHRVKTFSSIYIRLSKQNPNMPPSNTFKLIDLVFLHWDKSQLLWSCSREIQAYNSDNEALASISVSASAITSSQQYRSLIWVLITRKCLISLIAQKHKNWVYCIFLFLKEMLQS